MSQQPNFFLAGAAKSGTSALFHYLGQHPDFYNSPVKEPHYFCSHHFPDSFSGPGDASFSRDIVRAEPAYRQLFTPAAGHLVAGEASVYYLLYPDVAARVHAWNPQAKVAIVLRNPVQRAFSAYMHLVRDGRETRSFADALAAEPQRQQDGYQPLWWYRAAGLYSQQVQQFLDVFGRDAVKIYLYEDLVNAADVVREVWTWLGLPPAPVDTSIRHNVSGHPRSRVMYEFLAKPNAFKDALKPFLPADLRRKMAQRAKEMTLRRESPPVAVARQLQSDFSADIVATQRLIGRDLSHWLAPAVTLPETATCG